MAYKKIQKHIEIVRSTTPSLSSMGRRSCDALFAFLSSRYQTVGVSIVNDEFDLHMLLSKQPDLVFSGMKYVPGNVPGGKIWISEQLEEYGITHTGSPKEAIEAEQNKPFAKQCVMNAGVQTSPFIIIQNGKAVDAGDVALKFPLFVKPTDLGAGKGIDDNSVVHTLAELNTKVKSLHTAYATDALVEQYLPGREFSVAVLKHEYLDEIMAMPLELVAGPNDHGDRILSQKLKSAPLETPVLPVVDPQLQDKLIDLAKNAFTALGARDYGRVDIRLDAAGIPHFLEANLIPCIIQGSGNFPKACVLNIGMDYEAMIMHIVRLAFARSTENETALDYTNDTAPIATALAAFEPA